MNQQSSKAIGVVLLLASALLAALFAQGASAPPGAGAQNGPPPPLTNIIEVDGGRDQELTFKAYVPSNFDDFDDPTDSIAITLMDFSLPTTSELILTDGNGGSLISVDDSGGNNLVGITAGNARIDGNKLVLIGGTDGTIEEREYVTITIKAGTGILTPETPKGFEDTEHPQETGKGYPVGITFIDSTSTGPGEPALDNNIVVVKNPLSSTIPRAARVRVTLVTNTSVRLGSSDEITVDFSGDSDDSEFVIPASISNTSVNIYPGGLTGNYFNPSSILVQGNKVTLLIPPTIPDGRADPEIAQGADYAIRFLPAAGIGNPYAAGNLVIKVSSSEDRETVDRITAVIRRTTTIDTLEGPRGTEFILEGKGYPKGHGHRLPRRRLRRENRRRGNPGPPPTPWMAPSALTWWPASRGTLIANQTTAHMIHSHLIHFSTGSRPRTAEEWTMKSSSTSSPAYSSIRSRPGWARR